MRRLELTKNHASPKERTRASTKALKKSRGERKNFRFTAEMVRDLKVAQSLNREMKTEVGIIALALQNLVGRRREPHRHWPGDQRQLGRLNRRGAPPAKKP